VAASPKSQARHTLTLAWCGGPIRVGVQYATIREFGEPVERITGRKINDFVQRRRHRSSRGQRPSLQRRVGHNDEHKLCDAHAAQIGVADEQYRVGTGGDRSDQLHTGAAREAGIGTATSAQRSAKASAAWRFSTITMVYDHPA
jgi:hypothetical protein